jgi:hypothetical protein
MSRGYVIQHAVQDINNRYDAHPNDPADADDPTGSP